MAYHSNSKMVYPLHTAQKNKAFLVKFTDLVTFTEEILNGKLQFLYSLKSSNIEVRQMNPDNQVRLNPKNKIHYPVK